MYRKLCSPNTSIPLRTMSIQRWNDLFNWPTFDLFEPTWALQSRLAPSASQQQLASLGAADVIEKDNEYQVVVDTPGLKSADVKVCVHSITR